MPLLRKFLAVPGVQEARARYYEAVEDSKTAKETFERFKKQGRFEEMETYQGENEALISMAKVAEKTSKRIKAAREALVEAQNALADALQARADCIQQYDQNWANFQYDAKADACKTEWDIWLANCQMGG